MKSRKVIIILLATALLLCSCAVMPEDVVPFEPLMIAESSSTATEETTLYTTSVPETTIQVTEPVETTEVPIPETTAAQQREEPEPQDEVDEPPVQNQTASEANTVWIPTKGGKKYHIKPTCSNMNGPEEVTKSEAEAKGFTPCKKCYK